MEGHRNSQAQEQVTVRNRTAKVVVALTENTAIDMLWCG